MQDYQEQNWRVNCDATSQTGGFWEGFVDGFCGTSRKIVAVATSAVGLKTPIAKIVKAMG